MSVFAKVTRLAVGSAMLCGLAAGAASAAEEVNLYSYRQPHLMQPLIDAFTADTGIAVNMVYANKGLLERLVAEGRNTPADVVITANAGRLADLVEADVLQSVTSPKLEAAVPAQFQDPQNRWFGITKRGRVLYASRERIASDRGLTYEGLADAEWKGKICARPFTHPYMIDLISSMIASHGEAWTETWLDGVKANLARKPQGNDRAQIKAVAQGECDIAIGNTYYYGIMLSDPEQRPAAEAVRPVFPNQDGRGAHMNITGAGVTKHAKHPENGVKLIEYLTSARAQEIYAAQNFEFPVVAGVAIDPVIAVFGEFKEDSVSLADVAAQRRAAAQMVDRAGLSS